MSTNGETQATSTQRPMTWLRSARLRGVMRDDWLNAGFEQFPEASRLHWSTPIDAANVARAALGLPLLLAVDDPAPDIASQWTIESDAMPNSASVAIPLAGASTESLANPRPGAPTIALPLSDLLQWSGPGRLLTFILAASSIGCMLVDNTGLITVRSFFFAVLAPACAILCLMAIINRSFGDGRLSRALLSGALAGLGGAVVFNIFRIPFVYSTELGLDRLGIPRVPFFNLYPRIGAILMGQPVKQPSYELATYFAGWGYHLIRAMTTGIMFAAAIGEIRAEINAVSPLHPISVRAVIRGALLTVTIQSCLLLSPYAKLFSIELTPRRVFIILLAHLSFGISIALFYAWRSGSLDRSIPRTA